MLTSQEIKWFNTEIKQYGLKSTDNLNIKSICVIKATTSKKKNKQFAILNVHI